MSATMDQVHYMSLAVVCEDCIIHLEYFICDDEEYQTGWYWFEDDGPPGFFGKTAKEAADELRAFIKKTGSWSDSALLYALCAVCKRMDQGDTIPLRDAFLQVGYGTKETDLALDLIYQKVLE